MSKPRLLIALIARDNTSSALRATLDSLTRQTYERAEIIAIDANEWNSAASLSLQEDIARYTRVKYYQPPRLLTMGALRNEALEMWECDYISFVTTDEVWDSRKAGLQVDQLEADSEAVASCCNGQMTYSRIRGDDTVMCMENIEYLPAQWLLNNPVKTGGQMVYRTSALKSAGGFGEEMDELCDLNAMLRLSGDGHVVFLPVSLFNASVTPTRRTYLSVYNDYCSMLGEDHCTDILLLDRTVFLEFNLLRAGMALRAGLTVDYVMLLAYTFLRSPMRATGRLISAGARLLSSSVRRLRHAMRYASMHRSIMKRVRSGKLDGRIVRAARKKSQPFKRDETDAAPVTHVPAYAFIGTRTREILTIPDSVREIGKGAFAGCTELTTVVIPDSVHEIGKGAFMGCTNLRSVAIGRRGGFAKLGASAFAGCTALERITMPETMREMGRGAFAGCVSLRTPEFYAIMNETGEDEEPSFPRGLEVIPDEAFRRCESLDSVRFETGSLLRHIGERAFEGCKRLDSMWIDAQLTSISRYAFRECTGLKDFVMVGNNSLGELGRYAFMNCQSLGQFVFPASLTCVERGAFYACKSLQSVRLPATMINVRPRAFAGCESLSEAFVDSPYTHIRRGAFDNGAMIIRGKVADDLD